MSLWFSTESAHESLSMEPATPNMTPRAAAARWKEAVLSPWSPEEMASVSPSLDGYVPFGAEPPPRRPLRPVNGFSGSGLSANGLTKRTPQGQPAKDRTPPVLAVQPGFSPEQNRKLGALRQAAAEPYDASAHEQMLRELWAWGKLGSEGSFSRVSPCWRTLGFRQDDPALDLHGCGAIGLRQLVHFCARGGAHAALAADAFPVSPFPLAMASLNVTLALCSHLRLLPAAASSQPPCADPTLRNFLRFTADLEPGQSAPTPPRLDIRPCPERPMRLLLTPRLRMAPVCRP
jgi:hypothetical protein